MCVCVCVDDGKRDIIETFEIATERVRCSTYSVRLITSYGRSLKGEKTALTLNRTLSPLLRRNVPLIAADYIYYYIIRRTASKWDRGLCIIDVRNL